MSAVFSGNTPGAGGMCQDFDTNATELNSALENTEILTNGVLTLTKIDGSTTTNNIPYFADFVISGLKLNISNVPVNRTLTYTSGTYQINAQVYSIPVGANFQLTVGHPTLPRIDILYLTNTNNIFYQTGTPSVTPVQPTAPAGTLLLAAIGVQINATTSLNYTLVTVNTNAATIASPVLTPGTVTGSHLYWDGLNWSENTFWNVGNSTFDPTARIHTYTDTDSSGILTSNKLGDSAGERGFNWIVNHTLNGFITQMDITTDGGETFFTLDSSDSNLFAISSIWNSAARNTFTSSSNTTDRSTEILQEDTGITLKASTEVFDPLNNNTFTQNITSTISDITQGTNYSGYIQDAAIGYNALYLQNTFGASTFQMYSQSGALFNLLNIQDASTTSEFIQNLLSQRNILDIRNGTNSSTFTQDLVALENTLSITDGTDTSQLNQQLGASQLLVLTSVSKSEVFLTFQRSRLGFTNNSNNESLLEAKTSNIFLTTDNNYIANSSNRSVLDMNPTITYLYNRNQPLTLNSELQLDHINGTVLKYEDIAIGSSSSLTLSNNFNGRFILEAFSSAGNYSQVQGIGTNVGLISQTTVANNSCNITLGLSPGKIELIGGIIKKQRNTAVSTAILNDDYMIVATAAPITITLPAAPVDGQEITVVSNGVATGGNPITIDGNGKNINAVATSSITTAYGKNTLVYNSALNKWLITVS